MRIENICSRMLLAAALSGLPATVPAQAPGPAGDDQGPVAKTPAILTLENARSQALERQPLLQAQAANQRSAQASSVAAAQLPDPRLNLGVLDLPVNTDDAFSLQRDGDTQLLVGVSQALPRAEKRRLRSEREAVRAQAATEELERLQREITRDVTLGWIDVYRAERALALARTSSEEASAQIEAGEIAYRAGRATQAELAGARVEANLAHEAVDDWAQQAVHARNALSRWIGDAAQGVLPDALPPMPAPPPIDTLAGTLTAHPHLSAIQREVEAARVGVSLAEQGYKPDFEVEFGFGYRPNFSEMAMLKVGMDLPVFTANRQDRELAARVAEFESAQSRRDDALRQHLAELRTNHADWRLLEGRLARFDRDILPQARLRVAAATLAYENGRGSFHELLAARRAVLELEMQRLDLEADRARHWARLEYLAPDYHQALQVSRHD